MRFQGGELSNQSTSQSITPVNRPISRSCAAQGVGVDAPQASDLYYRLVVDQVSALPSARFARPLTGSPLKFADCLIGLRPLGSALAQVFYVGGMGASAESLSREVRAVLWAKRPFHPSPDRLPDRFCRLPDRLSGHSARHWVRARGARAAVALSALGVVAWVQARPPDPKP